MTNLEKLEAERETLYGAYIKAIGTAREATLLAQLEEMDAILDGNEEADELNTSTNWDEWVVDHMIDMGRENMAYEI